MKDHLKELIGKFSSFKVLVIGDAILDTYIKGITDRISREAPVPIINVLEEENDCGGAANTAINVAALGAQTYFLSVIGKDENGKLLTDVLKKHKVNTECLIKDKDRKTLAKKRITAFSNILLRIDEGDIEPIGKETEKKLLENFKLLFKNMDAIILSDYGYGIITEQILECVKKLQEKKSKILVIDSKDLRKFKLLNPTAVKPNYEETIRLLNVPKLLNGQRVDQILEVGKKLHELTGAEHIAATIDADGTILFEKGKKPFLIPSIPQDNKNAIGAGDTFISAMTLSLCCGASGRTAIEIASAAAAVIMQKEGTVVCTMNELKAYFNDTPKYIQHSTDLTKKIDALKKEGKKIVFTNGCFDILHKGHVSLLNQAKALGDVLIVGINGDASIKRLKGNERPINCLDDRITVLAGLEAVDYLVSFEEDSPYKIIKAIKPDVFAKGGDYEVESILEAPLVKQLGGEVKIITFVDGKSTTGIIDKIKETQKVVYNS
jgi:D-beta-D-heptose 7-phosphate kinase/D-beta-D-heptose 1-phosphate adenosyltransferase